MLTKRTNILFQEDFYQKLQALSYMEGRSIGELVRNALVHTYFQEASRKSHKRQSFVDRLLELRKKQKKVKKINYKKLIEYGRI